MEEGRCCKAKYQEKIVQGPSGHSVPEGPFDFQIIVGGGVYAVSFGVRQLRCMK
jgi:hypothetical protein